MIAPGNVVTGGDPLNGKQIADIFVDAARKDGFAYYPLTVDWATSEAEHPRHLYPCTAGKIFMNLSRALRPAF